MCREYFDDSLPCQLERDCEFAMTTFIFDGIAKVPIISKRFKMGDVVKALK